MQKCMRCFQPLEDGAKVMMKCPGIYEEFSAGVHRVIPEDVEEIWCMKCEDEDE